MARITPIAGDAGGFARDADFASRAGGRVKVARRGALGGGYVCEDHNRSLILVAHRNSEKLAATNTNNIL